MKHFPKAIFLGVLLLPLISFEQQASAQPSAASARIHECGNQTCDPEEETNPLCPNDCHIPRCGDGIAMETGKECDDGNTVDGDGCTHLCMKEDGYTCVSKSLSDFRSYCYRCGNGKVEWPEECDGGVFCTKDCKRPTTSQRSRTPVGIWGRSVSLLDSSNHPSSPLGRRGAAARIAAPLVGAGGTEAKIIPPAPGPVVAGQLGSMIPMPAGLNDCPQGYVESPESVNSCPKTYPVDVSEIQGLMRTDQCLYSDAVDYRDPQSVADNIRTHCRCGWDEMSLNDYIQAGSITVRNQIFQMINDCYSNLLVSEYVAEESSHCALPQRQVCPGALETTWKDSKTYICRTRYPGPIVGAHTCINGFFEGECEDIYGLSCPQNVDAYDCVTQDASVKCPDPQAKLQKLSNSTDVCCTVFKTVEIAHQRSPGNLQ